MSSRWRARWRRRWRWSRLELPKMPGLLKMHARVKRMVILVLLVYENTQWRKAKHIKRRAWQLLLLVAFEKASQDPIDLARTTVATYVHIFDHLKKKKKTKKRNILSTTTTTISTTSTTIEMLTNAILNCSNIIAKFIHNSTTMLLSLTKT